MFDLVLYEWISLVTAIAVAPLGTCTFAESTSTVPDEIGAHPRIAPIGGEGSGADGESTYRNALVKDARSRSLKTRMAGRDDRT